jgi:hypothetical protein
MIFGIMPTDKSWADTIIKLALPESTKSVLLSTADFGAFVEY